MTKGINAPVMKGKLMDWSALGWAKFQKLSLYLAQGILPQLRFEEYLKRGNAQHGIDLISTVKDGKYTVVQCKDEDLSPGKLEALVQEFKDGDFFGETSHFILATTSDLQTEPRRKCIAKITHDLDQFKVTFEPWDVTFFEDQLKHYYTLVAYYFGIAAAKEHCFLQYTPKLNELKDFGENFIPRTVVNVDKDRRTGSLGWYLRKDETVNLTDFLIQERLTHPRLCIIGDPYQGKSSLLKQTAYELGSLENAFVPIFLELKAYTLQPIEIILNQQEGAWLSTPLQDLIIFIDGLDEVPTDRFNDAIGYIKEFADNYPNLSIVFSCRKLFYYHYSIEFKLYDFKTYELYDLNNLEIEPYVRKKLNRRYDKFMEEVRALGLEGLLYEPFYLTELINSYTKPPYQIATSKAVIIERFIQRSIEKSDLRKLSKGRDFKHLQAPYRASIQKMAFSLQVLGLNAIGAEAMQELFSEKELEILQHSALVTITNDQWFFTSALFQEFLTARVLLKMDFKDVIPLVTVGNKIVKIKAKWVQTFGTLLALTAPGDPKRNKYIAVMEADNIELLFDTDRSKYDEAFRFKILKKLVERSVEKNIRTMVVHENTIGAFIGSDEKSIRLLLKTGTLKGTSAIVKQLCFNILRFVRPDKDLIRKIELACIKEISSTKEYHVAKTCIAILCGFKIYNSKTAGMLVGRNDLSLAHEYRSEVYRYLTEGKFADQFYDYGLDGVIILIEYNQGISHHDSELSLMAFLLEAGTKANLQKLLIRIVELDWLRFMEYKTEESRTFMISLINICVRIFQSNPEIVDDVIQYVRTLNKRDLMDDMPEINDFFERTQTHSTAVVALHKEILGDQGYQYSGLLTEATLPYLLFEYEAGNYKTSVLYSCIYGLNKAKKTDVADKLFLIYKELVSLEETANDRSHIDPWQELERTKSENDARYLQSAQAFSEGLIQLFDSFGKKDISTDDIYIEANDPEIRKNVFSNLMFKLLLRCRNDLKEVHLEQCLKIVNTPASFDFFLVEETMESNNGSNNQLYREFIEKYYNREIAVANFENAFYPQDGKWFRRQKEVLLGRIFEKFGFSTPVPILVQLIWMDKGGARNLRDLQNDNVKTLTGKIIESLGKDHINSLRDEVLSNMQIGIFQNDVFGNHAALAHHFKIVEAKDIIVERIRLQAVDNYDIPYLAKFYLELGGESKKLIPAFRRLIDYYPHTFIEMADIMVDYEPAEVKRMLSSYLKRPEQKDDPHISVANRLSAMGEFNGFEYLVNKIKVDGKSPITIQGRFTIEKQNTVRALKKLEEVVIHVLDKDSGSFHESARSITVEWLFSLAGKSEKDLQLVVDFFHRARAKYASLADSDNFHWYADQCIEKFRDSGASTNNITTLKNILENIPDQKLDFVAG